MRAEQTNKGVLITGVQNFDLEATFECGQCFRWDADDSGAYLGVHAGHAARIEKADGGFLISGGMDEFDGVWRDYLDLDRDYAAIGRGLGVDEYMKRATDFGAGIRILRQDFWEAACSFIISQCNNIPRIKGIIRKLCAGYGEKIETELGEFYSFPGADIISRLSPGDLDYLKSGYRAPYIIAAAKMLNGGEIDPAKLRESGFDDAIQALKAIPGVGDKVANCVTLYGLHKLDAFPVDTWMKKAIAENYGGKLDPSVFGEYAGIAQQYMFYYARNSGSG